MEWCWAWRKSAEETTSREIIDERSLTWEKASEDETGRIIPPFHHHHHRLKRFNWSIWKENEIVNDDDDDGEDDDDRRQRSNQFVVCTDAIARISLFARSAALSLSFLCSRSLCLLLFRSPCALYMFVWVYEIVCFTLDVNCEERRRSFNVRRVLYLEKKNKNKKKRQKRKRKTNRRRWKRKDHLSTLSLSPSPPLCLHPKWLYVVQITKCSGESRLIYSSDCRMRSKKKNVLGKIYSKVTLKRSCRVLDVQRHSST